MQATGTPKERKLRLLLADDHRLVLDGLVAVLTQEGFEVAAVAENGSLAVERFVETRPDLGLIDLRMPGMGGIQCVRNILEKVPNASLIVLSSFADDEEVRLALASGAKGYLLKDITRGELAAQIRQACGAEARWSPAGPPRQKLSKREVEVLRLLVAGQSNKSIASELNITEGTVKLHLYRSYKKLGVRNRTEAMGAALREGLGA
ncbi:hypothetical protein ABS71_12140 [bacterium SCN 62-11]|nr:MAG: hypothetical protein ABS71_12140 [bacterium SCN 62-11]